MRIGRLPTIALALALLLTSMPLQKVQAVTLSASYTATPPTVWSGAQPQAYSVTVMNTGTETWSATGTNRVRLGIHFGTASDGWGTGWATDERFVLPGNVAAGGSVTLNVIVTPPAGAGSFVLRHRMVKEGIAWFAQIKKTNVTVAAQPALGAWYTATPPTSWTNSQTRSWSVTVKNTGTTTWSATGTNRVRLGIHFGTASDGWGTGWATDQRFVLPYNIGPGVSVTLAVNVTAPAGSGSYVLRHRMVKEAVAWFAQIKKTNVTVAAPALTLVASYTATPPTSWTGGQTKTWSVSVTNTGTATWLATGTNRVRLGIHFGTASDGWGTGWATDQRFVLPFNVGPGASATWTVNVTAPLAAGSYVLRHRMVKEGIAWFAQIKKTNVTVSTVTLLPDMGMDNIRNFSIDTTTQPDFPGQILLRFTTIMINIGDGPMEVRGHTKVGDTMSTEQHIFRSDGTFTTVQTPIGMHFAGDGHSHWHITDLAAYELFNSLDASVGTSDKSGFCLWDNDGFDLTLPGAPQSLVYDMSGCGAMSATSVTTGLSVGWGDIYPASYVLQWIDITGLPTGDYTLIATTDADDHLDERCEGNNDTTATFHIDMTLNTVTNVDEGVPSAPC